MRKIYRFTGLVVAIGFGWVLGTLRLPDFDVENQFVFGMFSGALIIVLIALLFILFRRNFFLKANTARGSKWSKVAPWMAVVLLGLTATYYYRSAIEHAAVLQLQEENSTLQKLQNKLIDASRKSEVYNGRMLKLISDLTAETNSTTFESLSDLSIQRIISLSNSIEPYSLLLGDTLSPKKYSPERGELLQLLNDFQLDSSSLKQIIQSANFQQADLSRADLEGMNLTGIDLTGANFENANLKQVNLSNSILTHVNFNQATLDNAVLDDSDIKYAKFNWTNLKSTSLKNTNLKGADFSNAKMQGADFEKSFIQWSCMKGSILKGSNLSETDLYQVNFEKANLKGANLENTLIRAADFTDADLTDVSLANAATGAEWFNELPKWNVVGMQKIKSNYELLNESGDRFPKEKFILKYKVSE